jgi:hypothetical protein
MAWSGWSHCNAAILAAHGFLAFPFGYSIGGNAWNAGNNIDVPLDRTAEAFAALREFAFTGREAGLYGVSRGAEHALLLVSLMVRDGGGRRAGGGGRPYRLRRVQRGSVARHWRSRLAGMDPGQRAWTRRGSSECLLPTTPIEIERYGGALFLSHGTKDQIWSDAMTRRLEARLRQHGRAPEVHYYEGQYHIPEGNEHQQHLIGFFGRNLAEA